VTNMTPAELGYRLPAEWEPHAATWLAWPHRRATWLGDFAAIPAAYARVARQIAAYEPVRVVGRGAVLAEARRHLADVAAVTFVDIPTSIRRGTTTPASRPRSRRTSVSMPSRPASCWKGARSRPTAPARSW